MPDRKILVIGFVISLIVSIVNVIAMNDVALMSGIGLGYAVGGALAMVAAPIAICSVPAGVHWLIWRNRLEGNELSIMAIWFFVNLSIILAALSQFMNN